MNRIVNARLRGRSGLFTVHWSDGLIRAIDAQAALPALQGRRRSWFAGAWTGYGFHEDGLKSAVAVVEAMGVEVPWRRGRVHAAAVQQPAPLEAAA